MNQEFQNVLNIFTGQRCWCSVAGEGTGSIFSLGFGRKIPLSKPLSNMHLSKDKRENTPEYSIMVWSSWALQKDGNVICDSDYPNDNDGPIVLGLKKLEGKTIKSIEATEPFLYLNVEFDDGYLMKIKCDGEEMYGDDGDNYTIFTPEVNYTVTTVFKLIKEKKIEQNV